MVAVESFNTRLYEADDVSPVWKGCQICIYVAGAFTSIASAYAFSIVYVHYFDQNCLLYGSVRFVPEEDETRVEERTNRSTRLLPYIGQIDNFNTEWGKESLCLFCQYVPISSFISYFVWATFFTMCGKGGRAVRGLPSPWRIVAPAIFFNIIYFILSFAYASYLQGGYRTFCTNFIAVMNESSCEQVGAYTMPASNVYSYIAFSELFAWGDVGMWLLSIGLLILRCIFVPDFRLHHVELYMPSALQALAISETNSDEGTSQRQRHVKICTSAEIKPRFLFVAEEVLKRIKEKNSGSPDDVASNESSDSD